MQPHLTPPQGAPRVAVIGGSGVYELFAPGTAQEMDVATPFGTSVSVSIGTIGGRSVAFVPRHGSDHSTPPHRIPARALVWALASIGVQAVISTAAVGSLNTALPIGSIVLVDQLVDRTHGRADTYFDQHAVRHLPFADPFSPALREIAIAACPELAPTGTVVVIQGPRFSTRAESDLNRASGIDLVNMTLYPEVALTAELGIDTIALCLVTDVDSGATAEEAVTAEIVFARLDEMRPRLLDAIARVVAAIPADFEPRELIDADAVRSVREASTGVE